MPDPMLMSFGEHLDELRKRLVFALVGLGALFVLGLVFGGPLLSFLTAPLIGALRDAGEAPNLLATSPLETFASYLKVATVFALVLGMPWVLFQTWRFVAPGLYAQERRFVYFLFPLSIALTLAGIAILYLVILPLTLRFLILFGTGLVGTTPTTAPLPEGAPPLASMPVLDADPTDAPVGSMWFSRSLGQLRLQVEPARAVGWPASAGGAIVQQYRISEYVNLVFMLGLAFAIAFQVPMVQLLLAWAGLLKHQTLTAYRKHVLLGCVVGAALLPTQDPWSLIVLSALLYGLFELGIVLMRVVPARRIAQGLGPAAPPAPAPREPAPTTVSTSSPALPAAARVAPTDAEEEA